MRIRPVILLLLILILPTLLVTAQSGTIAYGETVTGTITDENPTATWTFEGAADDQITIVMEATDLANGALDTLLRLEDASGEILAENDDASMVTTNSAIEAFILPADGTYTITTTRYNEADGTSTGDFALTLNLGTGEEVEPTETPEPSTSADGDPITYDTPVTGTLNAQNFEDRWVFEGTAGDVITIRMTKTDPESDLDSFLQLLDASGEVLAENDDITVDLRDSEIVDFSLPADGSYTIVATRYGVDVGTSSGDYALEIVTGGGSTQPVQPTPSAQEATPTATPAAPTSTPVASSGSNDGTLAYDEFVTGSLEANSSITYEFTAAAGDSVTVSVKRAGSELDPAVAIMTVGGASLAQNEQFNGAADARIEGFNITTSGRYQIVVSSQNNSSGGYTLHLFNANEVVTTVIEPTPTPTSTPVTLVENTLDLSNATLAITVSWEGSSDFDISVREFSGAVIDLIRPESSTGGIFGGDANGGCNEQFAEPSETVYWEGEPPTGTFRIDVAYILPCNDRGAHPFTITVTLNGEVVEVIEGELNEGETGSYEWTNE